MKTTIIVFQDINVFPQDPVCCDKKCPYFKGKRKNKESAKCKLFREDLKCKYKHIPAFYRLEECLNREETAEQMLKSS
jgi:hypothetical protein